MQTEPRPSAVNRRTVLAGAAWSVPGVLVAAAAPAFAASCDPITTRIDWASTNYTYIGPTSGKYTIPDLDGAGPQQAVTLTITQTSIGSNTQTGSQYYNGWYKGDPNAQTKLNDNLKVTTYNVGGTGDRGLAFHQSPKSDSNKGYSTANLSSYSFTFSRPVSNLSFTITDIDSHQYDFDDMVSITSASPYTYTKADSTFIQGTGTYSNPFSTAYYQNVPDTGTAGNVTIKFASVTSFNLYYWNYESGYSSTIDGDQRIFLSDFTVTYNPC